VRDNAVIRSTGKYPVEVGSAVLIGPHTALFFGCTIEYEVFWLRAHGYAQSARQSRRA
jgi:carbonic anhydrase/acetyltransferase-like protein (isoleucine patch superfamily)